MVAPRAASRRPSGGEGSSPPVYFPDPASFRRWLERHHAAAAELLVGFHKRGSGLPSMTWPESVDEALCFGWIDGVRRRVDDQRYTIRFTPRRPGSIWSTNNVARAAALVAAGRMRPAGEAAFAARSAGRTGVYSFERRTPARLSTAEARRFEADAAAWARFQAEPPSYRRVALHWVTSAKRPETRARRLETLIACAGRGERIPPLRYAGQVARTRRTGGQR